MKSSIFESLGLLLFLKKFETGLKLFLEQALEIYFLKIL